MDFRNTDLRNTDLDFRNTDLNFRNTDLRNTDRPCKKAR
jgi:hypothetical protein